MSSAVTVSSSASTYDTQHTIVSGKLVQIPANSSSSSPSSKASAAAAAVAVVASAAAVSIQQQQNQLQQQHQRNQLQQQNHQRHLQITNNGTMSSQGPTMLDYMSINPNNNNKNNSSSSGSSSNSSSISRSSVSMAPRNGIDLEGNQASALAQNNPSMTNTAFYSTCSSAASNDGKSGFGGMILSMASTSSGANVETTTNPISRSNGFLYHNNGLNCSSQIGHSSSAGRLSESMIQMSAGPQSQQQNQQQFCTQTQQQQIHQAGQQQQADHMHLNYSSGPGTISGYGTSTSVIAPQMYGNAAVENLLLSKAPPFVAANCVVDTTSAEKKELGGADLEPVPRDRCNTWPMRRPNLDINAQTSPIIHDRIPEEDNSFDEDEDCGAEMCDVSELGGTLADDSNVLSPSDFSNDMSPRRSDSALGDASSRTDSPPSSKKSTTRRNAWGNMSYADLITQAILNSPEKRLTLSQVYEWMVNNVPYFRDKGDSNSSAGWKEYIRFYRNKKGTSRGKNQMDSMSAASGSPSSGGELSALKESIKCMKSEADALPYEISNGGVTQNDEPNTATLNNGNDEDNEFLGAEARSRCYTWPVAATEHQPLNLNFPVISSRDDTGSSLTTSAEGSCASLLYQQHHAQLAQQQSRQQQMAHQSRFLTLMSSSASMMCSPMYSSSQPDLCIGPGPSPSDTAGGALSNFSYYRTLCSSSPTFGISSVGDVQPPPPPAPPNATYFASEASCSFMRPPSHCGMDQSNILNGGLVSNPSYDFRNMMPNSEFNSSQTLDGSTCNDGDAAEAKMRKRVRKSELGGAEHAGSSLANLLPQTATATAPQKKPNAWGSDSYAELIEKAILSSPGGRLKLNEIYDWFIEHIPYFCKRSSQDGAVGWKNSIRHNLSLHSRFMRIQNEGAGKSSWWVINPEAKPGRNPRRRAATLEAATKAVFDRKRRGAKKRLEINMGRVGGTLQSAGTSAMSSQASMLSQDLFSDFGDAPNFNSFRPRTQSILSVPGTSSRLSPTPTTQEPPGFLHEDFNFCTTGVLSAASGAPANVSELLDRTDQMHLDGAASGAPASQPINGGKMEQQNTQQQTSFLQQQQKIEAEIMDTSIKQEAIGVAQPPSYQELNVVRAGSQVQQNPLLRSQLQQTHQQQQQQQLKADGTNGRSSATGALNYYNGGSIFGTSQTPQSIAYSLHSAPWQQTTPQPPNSNTFISLSPAATQQMHSTQQQQQQHIPQSLPNYMSQFNSCATSYNGFPVSSVLGGGLVGNGVGGDGAGGGGSAGDGGVMTLPMDLENLAMNPNMVQLDVEELLRYEYRLDTQNPEGQLRFDLP